LRRIRDDINCRTFIIGRNLGFPGAAPGDVPRNSNAYARVAAPFVRDLAANKVLEKIKRDLAMINMQYPESIDEIAKKKRKKIIKWKIKTGENL